MVFRPLERAFPAKKGQRFFRPEWWTDLCFFLSQYLLWSGLVLWLINLPALLLGSPLATLVGLAAFRGIRAIYIHSNVRLPIGPLRWFIGAPELHHWHHDRSRDAGNYANVSPLMDLAFGTYHCPPHEPESFGIQEPISRSYLGQMWHPFRRKKRLLK